MASAALSLRRHSIISLSAVVVVLGGLGFWSSVTRVSGAVIASGMIAVEGGSKRVQHQEGGIVGEINAVEGDVVEAGQVLLRLDGTATVANLAIIDDQLCDAFGLVARLTAESTGRQSITSPANVPPAMTECMIRVLEAQDALRLARRAAQDGIAARFAEQIEQIKGQIDGLRAQKQALEVQIGILRRELGDIEGLLEKGLVEATRATGLRRELARLEGELGRTAADIAAAQTTISERGLQIAQAENEFRSAALGELQVTQLKIAELRQQKVAAEDRLQRLNIRAPQAGIVHESKVGTVGGVISPGETLMLVVPQADELVVDARVGPLDADKVWVGQDVRLRLVGLNARTTPELLALVSRISPDLRIDPTTGISYYLVEVKVADGELARLADSIKLMPGMPAEAFMQTQERTVLDYLLEPIVQQLSHVFRESA